MTSTDDEVLEIEELRHDWVMRPSTYITVSALWIDSFRRSISLPGCSAPDASPSRPTTHGSRRNAVGYFFHGIFTRCPSTS